MCSMKRTTTEQHIVDKVKKVFEKFKIDPGKFCGITTDGAAAMTGKIKGFTKLFMDELGVKKSDIMVNNCIIHQENLCSKDIMKKVVQSANFICSRALNHGQFKAMLDELVSEYGDLVYFPNVRWLSRVVTLKRFLDLKSEIKNFVKEKGHDFTFFDDKIFLTDLAFLVDITQHLSDLNLKFPGKNQLLKKSSNIFSRLSENCQFFQSQLKKDNIVHLGTLRNMIESSQVSHFHVYVDALKKLQGF